MAHDGHAKVQHYVPQFLLRKFSSKKGQVHVYDKATGRRFPTNVKNVAGEGRFYDFQFRGVDLTIEPSLADLEGRASTVFDKLLHAQNARALSTEERRVLCDFFAVQLFRTRTRREQWRDMPRQLEKRLRERFSEDQLIGLSEYLGDRDENAVKMASARLIVSAPEKFAPTFDHKTWHVVTTSEEAPLLLNDNPMVLTNSAPSIGPWGNVGLSVRGVEIYFPMSPRVGLMMLCPSHLETAQKSATQARQLRSGIPFRLPPTLGREAEQVIEYARVLESGDPIHFNRDNVDHFNSLQIAHSERFLFSATGDFSLVESILKECPELREGPRMQIQ